MASELCWEANGIVARHFGVVTDTDLVAFVHAVYGDARFCDLRFVVHDLLACSGARFDPESVTTVAATDWAASKTNARIRLAVVAVNAEVLEMARTYVEAGLSPYPLRVFDTVEAARQWVSAPT